MKWWCIVIWFGGVSFRDLIAIVAQFVFYLFKIDCTLFSALDVIQNTFIHRKSKMEEKINIHCKKIKPLTAATSPIFVKPRLCAYVLFPHLHFNPFLQLLFIIWWYPLSNTQHTIYVYIRMKLASVLCV